MDPRFSLLTNPFTDLHTTNTFLRYTKPIAIGRTDRNGLQRRSPFTKTGFCKRASSFSFYLSLSPSSERKTPFRLEGSPLSSLSTAQPAWLRSFFRKGKARVTCGPFLYNPSLRFSASFKTGGRGTPPSRFGAPFRPAVAAGYPPPALLGGLGDGSPDRGADGGRRLYPALPKGGCCSEAPTAVRMPPLPGAAYPPRGRTTPAAGGRSPQKPRPA